MVTIPAIPFTSRARRPGGIWGSPRRSPALAPALSRLTFLPRLLARRIPSFCFVHTLTLLPSTLALRLGLGGPTGSGSLGPVSARRQAHFHNLEHTVTAHCSTHMQPPTRRRHLALCAAHAPTRPRSQSTYAGTGSFTQQCRQRHAATHPVSRICHTASAATGPALLQASAATGPALPQASIHDGHDHSPDRSPQPPHTFTL